MTDLGNPGELASLEPLEPLDAGAADMGGMSNEDALLQAARSGLACPAFNPYCRDKTYYKFLFAGVIMLLGCAMPFSADATGAGYQTMSGGVYTLIGIGMTWTWWGAISSNRSTAASLKWLLLSAIPLIAVIMNMMAFNVADAMTHATDAGWLPKGAVSSADWKSMFGDMGTALGKSAEAASAAARVETFWRLLGPGQMFVFFGALMAELGFFGGVMGGAKKNKMDKQQKQMAAAERKRR